jgi:hypothetical protein
MSGHRLYPVEARPVLVEVPHAGPIFHSSIYAQLLYTAPSHLLYLVEAGPVVVEVPHAGPAHHAPGVDPVPVRLLRLDDAAATIKSQGA